MSDFDVFAERAHALDRAMRSQLDEALLTAARWDEAQRLITEHRARQSRTPVEIAGEGNRKHRRTIRHSRRVRA